MKLISKLRNNAIFRKILYSLIIVFCVFYVFSVPSFGESTSVLRYVIYLSMFALGITSFIYCLIYKDFKTTKWTMLVPLFAIYAFIGTALFSKQFRPWFTLVLLTLSFFIFFYAFRAIGNKTFVVYTIAIAFFLFSLYYIFHYRHDIIHFKSFLKGSFRLGSDFDNENGIGAYAIIGLSTALYALLFTKYKIRYLFVIPFGTSLLVGLTTGSKTFLLSVVIFVLVFLFFKFKRRKWLYFLIIIAMFGFGFLALNLPFMATFKQRIFSAIGTIFGTGVKADTSTIERVLWTDYGFYLGFRRLITGYGVGGFAKFSGVEAYSHSNYAETICDFGLAGSLLFYSSLLVLLFRAIVHKRVDKSFIISFIFYYLVSGFSTVFYYKKIYYMILAFMFYLAFYDNELLIKKRLVPELKTILITCDAMGSGGAERVISVLSNEFLTKGVNVIIIGVADNGLFKPFYQLHNGITYIPLCKERKLGPLKRVIELRKKIKEIKPDVVVSFLPNANIYSCLSLCFSKIPHIVSERSNPYIDPKGKLTRLLKRIAFEFSDGCVFQTTGAMNYYSDRLSSRSTLIKNPILLKYIPKKYCKNKEKTVLAVGRLSNEKNYPCLFKAFKEFNSSKDNSYVLKIYGTGPLESELKIECQNIGIENKVLFMGNDSDWHSKEYKDSIFILNSNYEGLPNSLAEAMALGIPCISTDCPSGGPKELISDGVNGYLTPVNNSILLAEKMDKVISQDQKHIYDNTREMLTKCSTTSIAGEWLSYIKGLEIDSYI